MKSSKTRLVAALLFPIIVLMGNALMNHHQRASGEEYIVAIEGFDPRDLLSGHYLVFRPNYQIPDGYGCPTVDISATLCLKPNKRIYPTDELPASCELFLQGLCDASTQFNAGLERFYIPQRYAQQLEKKVQEGRGKLVLSIDAKGNPAIRDLLIDEQSWRNVVTD